MAVTQSHFRFGVEEGTEASHGWYATEDTNPAVGAGGIPLDTTFLLRFCLQCDGTAQSNVDAEFQFRVNGGTWTQISTSSNFVRAVTTSVFSNAANTTQRLSGTGTFETSSQGCTHDGISGGTAFDIVSNGNGETECSMQLRSADLASGDLVEFRLTRDGGNLLTYAVTPALTLPITVALSGVAATVSAGILTAALALGLSGAAATVSAGTVSGGLGLSGVSATSEIERASNAVRVGIAPSALLPTAGDFTEATRRAGFKKGSSTGVNYLHYSHKWSEVETSDGVYDWTELEWMLEEHPSPGRISITIAVVDFDGTRAMPAYLGAVAFNDSTVLAAYDDMLDDLFTVIGDRVEYVCMGQEVEVYFDANPTEIDEFSALIDSAKTKVTSLWSGRPTTVSFKAAVAVAGEIQTTFADILNSVTLPGITYYFTNTDLTVRDSNLGTLNTTLQDDILDILVGLGGSQPIIVTEFGCPTHANLNSSEAIQAQFFQHGLAVCQVYKDFNLITHVNCNWLHEWDEWLLDLFGFTGNTRDYIGSLGFHRTNGLPKDAFAVFNQHLQGGLDGDTSVAISGVAGTSALGTVTPAFSFTPTGHSATGAVGSLQITIAPALTTVVGTGSPGAFSPSHTLGLTGIPASSEVGTLTAESGAFADLTGESAAGSVGPLAPVFGVALTGVAATGEIGTLTPTFALALSGEGATGSLGTMTAADDHVAALSGVSATGALGDLVAPVTLVGVGGTGQLGTLSLSFAVSLSGIEATGAIGTVTPDRSFTLSGLEAAGSVGAFSLSSVVPLTGIPVNGQLGSISADGAGTASLVGTAGTGSVGTLTIGASRALTGASATSALGTATTSIAPSLTGVEAPGTTGAVGHGVSLAGNHGIGEAGAATASFAVSLSGVQAAGTLGAMIPLGGNDALTPLTGVSATATLGDLGANDAVAMDVVADATHTIDVVGDAISIADVTSDAITVIDVVGDKD